MWFGCLVHVRKTTEPKTLPLLMIEYSFSFASNAVPSHYRIDILHLSSTFPLRPTANLSSAS